MKLFKTRSYNFTPTKSKPKEQEYFVDKKNNKKRAVLV